MKRLLACLVACAAVGCSDPAPLAPDQDTWDVVVIVLDALPAKRTGLYGAAEPGLTAHLDRVGTRGTLVEGGPPRPTIVFDAAFASASYTLASTASLFTGLMPSAHRVLGLDSNVLDAAHTTLAEVLEARGFVTAALSTNPHISEEGQFDQGFGAYWHYFRDNFDNHTLPTGFIPTAGGWWRDNAGARRFLYAHLLPPHQPYTPPAPYDTRFGAEGVPRAEGLTPYLTELASSGRAFSPTDPDIARVVARYHASVNYADALLRDLLEALAGPDGTGLERTVVVITSDHGEAFGEHGQILHGNSVFEEQTRVPLIVSLPPSAPAELAGRFPHAVSTADLAATLCELVDVPWPSDTPKDPEARPLVGQSLVPAITEGRAPGYPVLSRSSGAFPLWGLRDDDGFVMLHKASGDERRFDRRTDPTESRPLSVAPGDPLRAALDAELERTRRAGERFSAGKVDMLIHKDALEQLGYFGDDAAPADEE